MESNIEKPKLMNNCPKCGLDLVEREGCKPVCTKIDCRGIILSNKTLKEWVLKEEPKQKNRKICKCKRAYENPLSEICSLCWNEIYPNEKDEIKEEDLLEPKQETLEKAAKNYANIPLHRDIDTEERYFNSNVRDYDAFIAGAKCQDKQNREKIGLLQIELNHTKTLLASCEEALEERDKQMERMYSEEEVNVLLNALEYFTDRVEKGTIRSKTTYKMYKDILEQFKKKQL